MSAAPKWVNLGAFAVTAHLIFWLTVMGWGWGVELRGGGGVRVKVAAVAACLLLFFVFVGRVKTAQ